MLSFNVMYSLETLTKDMSLVQEHKEKERKLLLKVKVNTVLFSLFSAI